MALTGKHFIAGRWTASGEADFTSINPRTKAAGEVKFYNATAEEIDQAVSAAADAFQITRNFSAEKLAGFLEKAADEIEALGDELLETADMEAGLGIPRFTGERGRTTGQLRAFAKLIREGSYIDAIIDTALPDRKPLPRPDIRRMQIPIGPVAVFGASNFPLAFSVAGGDTASAFAAGCPVIVKAHPSHPATSELVARAIGNAIKACGFPAGFFSLVQGRTIESGQNLVKHPQLAAVGFTGSLRGGRALADTAAQRPTPIPVFAEMGSINPVVILPGAIKERGDALAEGLANSVTLGSGQFCTNPGLIFVMDTPESETLIENTASQMKGKPECVLLNAGIEKALASTVETTRGRDGVNTLAGGEALEGRDFFSYSNTVMATDVDNFIADPQLQTEHFGPVTLFVTCKDTQSLNEAISHLEGNLTATVHATEKELEDAGQLFNHLREKVGRLIFNGFPTGVEVSYAMHHGGPYPATTAPGTTSVGMTAIRRFMRPVTFQGLPDSLLPDALKSANPLGIWRIVNGEYSKDSI